ncbi:isochorismatase family protein [Zwartia vadi]|uniref:isochorismatase family protein n=1 Tax=Zwartia vadi TaxID=3058168 RepID=UPI0025B5E916|nr:isochorismatase family protein [Zwartia vadi]MDN3987573.1 isochorismatase family protein [Zwartia vadi]
MSDLDIYKKQHFGQKIGFGRQSALLIIDFQVGFSSADVLGGFNINEAIANTAKLLKGARSAKIPVAHVRFASDCEGVDIGTFAIKVPSLKKLSPDSKNAQFVDSVKPKKGEWVSLKRHSSAFFGTNLASWLSFVGADTLFITGCTTSGCVRASTIDASAYGLRPMVVTDCVGDRAEGPHNASIFDMGQKYADLLTSKEALAYFTSLKKK